MVDFPFALKVSRPRFWFYLFGPYIVGLAAAMSTVNDLAHWRYLVFGLYFLFPANLLVYGLNDIFDYETDSLNQKKTDYEALVGPDKRKSLFLLIAALNLPFILIAAAQFNVLAFAALQTFIFLSIFYSSPPIRAKTKPVLDAAFNILYIMPGVFAYALVTRQLPPAELIIAGGFWTAAMHAYSAIPDIEADKKAGLKTIATTFGAYGTLAICFGLYAAAAFLSAKYLGITAVGLGSAYMILMLASVRSVQTGQIFKLYKAFPLINVAAGFVLFWQIVLSK
jgi:4-hydroxybenzoate polyprenyltransferase